MYFKLLKDNKQLFDILLPNKSIGSKKDKRGHFLYSFSNYKDVLRPIVS
jgi:hypothetical protein